MIAVITGASSGIGRATALEFARHGDTVIVASRQEEALRELVQECEQLGGWALAVPTDVTKEEEIDHLAQQAIAAYGYFDVWVNNAAVSLFGQLEELPMSDIRQLMEINVFGYLYGARAAVRQFKSQGHGLLINVSSMVALVGQPFSIPYSMSKFAIRGLSLSLAQELADQEKIYVSNVMPAVIDTPIFQHAANYMGQEVQAPKPVVPAADVAKAIFKLTENPQEEITVGNMARITRMQRLLMPLGLFDKSMRKKIKQKHFKKSAAAPDQGNLYEPSGQWNQVDGGWKAQSAANGTIKTVSLVTGAVLTGAAVGLYIFKNKAATPAAPAAEDRTGSVSPPQPVNSDFDSSGPVDTL